ncbi:MAG: cation diffusion facilitator family transporter [Ilumatobacteraceae bacterium]
MGAPPEHSHSHSHGYLARAGARHAGRLRIALALVVVFLVVQVVVGLLTDSLALLSDAGHMATDALGMGMALAAIGAASRATSTGHRTFGLYRLEILAALANAVLLFGVAGYVLVEAVRRFGEPPHISSLPVLVVGVVGLAVNVACFLLLREGAKDSLNLRGAYVEVLSDLVGSVGVIVGAIVMWATGWHWVDPLIGAAIGLFILPRAYRLGRDALRVLVQAAPAGMVVGDIRSALAELDGVADVHDLHVWTLTSEMDVLTAHLAVTTGTSTQSVLVAAQAMLLERFHLAHATLQVETGTDPRCTDLSW